ncbi:MAG TPA: hypothetical protein DEG17_24115 [Cyanobacteria bacterium UBA11149]|nr:hypothetical protein [Cyanobacteria bacterium UBA11367]HBE60634.1 hypothetical protein [Cyanobacteria bacterium UBA11366]HBK63983.1 hypothetical protein [Cyanobacteria bacterium UBA11166]HBR73916.1 hypothetical protein [Cyanobacteria bacterium UBA11159]HBS72474.1 hypothetical protein [Cyanobacteria bacterium UBA11153]HBW91867.1 hypothetical protein [Cyanobacteria bacterium UBA11149]HCA96865.1 hypothetical protein [Cyanobacteria bacterium UBA9226]
MQITLEVSDELGRQLQQFPDRWQEVLSRGLQELLREQSANFIDEKQIIDLLASQPTPEEILAIKPSAEFQSRVSDLLGQSKAGTLSAKGEAELERYLTIEHLVRLAKARAFEKLRQNS